MVGDVAESSCAAGLGDNVGKLPLGPPSKCEDELYSKVRVGAIVGDSVKTSCAKAFGDNVGKLVGDDVGGSLEALGHNIGDDVGDAVVSSIEALGDNVNKLLGSDASNSVCDSVGVSVGDSVRHDSGT